MTTEQTDPWEQGAQAFIRQSMLAAPCSEFDPSLAPTSEMERAIRRILGSCSGPDIQRNLSELVATARAAVERQHAAALQTEQEARVAAEQQAFMLATRIEQERTSHAAALAEKDAQIADVSEQPAVARRDVGLLAAGRVGIDHASMGQPCEAPVGYSMHEVAAYARGWHSVHESAVAIEMTRRINAAAERSSKAEADLTTLRAQVETLTAERDEARAANTANLREMVGMEGRHRASLAAVEGERASMVEQIAAYVESCREDDSSRRRVQVFDVLASHIRKRWTSPTQETTDV